MTIRIGKAAPRTLLPNQEVEITITIYADQNLKDVEVVETIGNGLIFLKDPSTKKLTFNKETHPCLAFIPKGFARSVTYKAKVTHDSDIVGDKLVIKATTSTIAKAIMLPDKKVKTRKKDTIFEVIAPFIQIKDIIIRDDLKDVVLILENVGLVDTHSLELELDFGINTIELKLAFFKIKVAVSDLADNEYKAELEFTEMLKQALPDEQAFCEMILFQDYPENDNLEPEVLISRSSEKQDVDLNARGKATPVLMSIAN